MPEYRLFRLDGAGKIMRVEVISAANDEEAIALARAARHPLRCELWLREQRIADIPPHVEE